MAVALTTAMQTQIANLYISIMGRNPDPVGFGYWCDAYANANGTQAALDSIASGFGKSPEFTSIYSGQTTAAAVGLMYNNILGRTQDSAGATYWTGVVNSYIAAGKTSGDALALTANAMITAAAANTGTADATLIAGKQTTAITAGTTAPTTAYTLTTSVESVTGSNLNVLGTGTIESTNGTFSATTFNSADIITLSGNSNQLSLTIDGTFKNNTDTALTAPVVSGVQTLNIRDVVAAGGTGRLTVDAANFTGLTTFNSNLSTGLMTVTNLASGGNYVITGNGSVSAGNLAAGYVAAATSATLNLVGGTKGTGGITLSGTGLTATTINSTGAANTVGAVALAATTTSLTVNATTGLTTGALSNTGGAALTSLTINGAGAVDLSTNTLQSTLTTINAAGNSGGVTLALGSSVTQKVTGSTGNDVITTGSILTTGSVDAGAGTGDTLVISAMNQVNTSALAAKYTNFETLRNSVDSATLDASLIAGITRIQITGTTANTLTNLTNAQTVQAFGDLGTGTITATLLDASGTSDTFNLVLGTGLTAAVAASTGTISINGYETLNLSTNAGPTASAVANRTSTIAAFTADVLTKINLTGAAFNLQNIATTKAITIDGSQLVGDGNTTAASVKGLTVGGSALTGSTITGSNFVDTFVIGAVGSTYNSGLGNDAISASQTVTAGSTVNGGGGTDTYTLSDTGTVTINDNTFLNITGMEKLVSAATTGITFNVGGYVNSNFATNNAGVLDFTVAGLTTGATINASGLSGSNSLKLSLTDTGGVTGAVGVTTSNGGADDITLVVANGAGTNAVTVTGTANTVGFKVDASGVVADTTALLGGSGADTLIGGGGVDTITGAGGRDTITLGAGSDIVRYGSKATAVSATGANVDTITDFTTTADTINLTGDTAASAILNGVTITALTGATAAMAAVVTNATTVNSIADVYTALATYTTLTASAAAGTATVAQVYSFTGGSAAGTYLVINDAVAGFQAANDIVIRVVGTVVATDITYTV